MKIANTKRCLPHVLAALLLMAGGATEALAQTSTVNVTGNITGNCQITGGASLTIPLGDVAASTLTAVGAVSPTAGMQNITLSCTGSPGMTMTMTGTQHSATSDTTVLALTGYGNPGVARGVGVQLLYSVGTTGTPTTLLSRNVGVPITGASTVTVRVGARYYTTGLVGATPAAGTANTTATLTFTIN
ncbi:fimbrial protein [Ralstonia sp. A12]|uniref:fimbrial protein n=1 Tax=Ralstonia sp. A12 TaxID=1217052 RepID=UPI0009FC4BA9|nr:fimbrial protein [Ralstonia sp. A12]